MADVDASVVGREMLEQLLADLTENHQRERTESTRMATENRHLRSHAPSTQLAWMPSTNFSVLLKAA